MLLSGPESTKKQLSNQISFCFNYETRFSQITFNRSSFLSLLEGEITVQNITKLFAIPLWRTVSGVINNNFLIFIFNKIPLGLTRLQMPTGSHHQ